MKMQFSNYQFGGAFYDGTGINSNNGKNRSVFFEHAFVTGRV